MGRNTSAIREVYSRENIIFVQDSTPHMQAMLLKGVFTSRALIMRAHADGRVTITRELSIRSG